mgnify:CR=1 FL=1
MSRTAVIIDDEPDIRRYIASILEDNGFETKTAEDAREGEDLILESPPDLICVDLMMPGRSGIQLFVRLKKNAAVAEIPLIMITGIKQEMNIDWADIAKGLRTKRPDGFIEKPIDPVRLTRVVEEVMAGKKEGVQFG